MSTKVLGKKPNLKLKSVTIMHSAKEGVRLPPEGEGGVTVHPAIRSKVPLKRKVRDGKLRKKHRSKDNSKIKSPHKKVSKKKKRVSAPVVAEESRTKDGEAVIEVPSSKVKKSPQHAVSNKKKSKKKEVIDYSSVQGDLNAKKDLANGDMKKTPLTPETDPVGKVQNWLLKSQLALPKSKSTPAGLTDKSNKATHKRSTNNRIRQETNKARSLGNLPGDKEKVRLQVVYKPPFKFSVKLRKPEKTSVVIEKQSERPSKKNNNVKNNARTAVIVRNVKEHEHKLHKPIIIKPITQQNVIKPETTDVVAGQVQTTFPTKLPNNIDSNVHTVQSDLEVLLSESEFLFSDD